MEFHHHYLFQNVLSHLYLFECYLLSVLYLMLGSIGFVESSTINLCIHEHVLYPVSIVKLLKQFKVAIALSFFHLILVDSAQLIYQVTCTQFTPLSHLGNVFENMKGFT